MYLKLLVEKVLAYFEGQQENLQIVLTADLQENIYIEANTTLLDVLLMNLIKNAFFHNVKSGFIIIKASPNSLEIQNSSNSGEIPREKLFQRFSKLSTNNESWGLGLAIAKKICDLNGWALMYSSREKVHTFSVQFSGITNPL